MILKMFAIYDRQTEIHHPPLYAHSVGHILRVVGDIFKDPTSPFHNHASDYQLYEIGTYDDATAFVKPLETIHLICSGSELLPFQKPGDSNE